MATKSQIKILANADRKTLKRRKKVDKHGALITMIANKVISSDEANFNLTDLHKSKKEISTMEVFAKRRIKMFPGFDIQRTLETLTPRKRR